MENKYDNGFWEFEKRYKERAQKINELLEEQFKLRILDNNFDGDYLNSICFNFHLYNPNLKKWIKTNVFSNFTEQTIISCYLLRLTDALMLNETNKINSLINSFKSTDLIKDIKINNNKIILITNNKDKIKIKNVFDFEDIRHQFSGRCHSGCEYLIINDPKLKNNSQIITLRDRYIGKFPIYHSVILFKNKYIIDPARNLIMSFSDYKKLFNLDIIMIVDRKTMLQEIEELKEKDSDFNQSSMNNVLKLAINRQIKNIANG